MTLELVATCALGLEAILAAELEQLGAHGVRPGRGSVRFRGHWRDAWRANWTLRTANRVLVRLATWPAADGDALAAGAAALVSDAEHAWDGVDTAALFDPDRSFAIRASTSRSQVTDARWVGLKTKDGIVDAQRRRFGRRASIDRKQPDLPLRMHLDQDRATLLLDTSGEPLDRRGYRRMTSRAPVREQLAAACVLAADWSGQGPIVDPMCGSGTLLIEAAWWCRGWAPGHLRQDAEGRGFAFEGFPGFDARAFAVIRESTLPAPAPDAALIGVDWEPQSIDAARINLAAAGLEDDARVRRANAFEFTPPETPGLVITNPAYGKRLDASRDDMRQLGDLLKQRYKGWRAVVLAGDPDRGKFIGLRPSRRVSVRNGPVDVRILVFDLH